MAETRKYDPSEGEGMPRMVRKAINEATRDDDPGQSRREEDSGKTEHEHNAAQIRLNTEYLRQP